MRERLRLWIAFCFYYSGLLKLALWWRQRDHTSLIILYYHRANGNLQAQLRYLRRHYRIMHLEDALEELCAPTEKQRVRRRQDRRIPLVVTFDDGYIDNYTEAFPLVRSLHIPITIFLIPGYVASGKCFWWLAPTNLVQSATVERVTIEEKSYTLTIPEDRDALVPVIDRLIRYAPSVAQREEILSHLEELLGTTLPQRDHEDIDNAALPMNWEHIHEMEASGLVSFGAHTMHHPILSRLADPSELQHEVTASRTILEQQLGHPIRTFAYPIGMLPDIGDQGIQAAKTAGFTWALTAFGTQNTAQTNPYLLARQPGDITLHWLVMAAELVGMLGIVSRIRKKYARFFKRSDYSAL